MFSKKPELRDLIHGLERRGSIRSDYSRRTLLATYDGRDFPPDSAFREIDCHDISRKGFAFYCFVKPMFSCVIVKLTGTESDIFVSARVVRFQQLNVGKFIVGCQFLQRLKVDAFEQLEAVSLALTRK